MTDAEEEIQVEAQAERDRAAGNTETWLVKEAAQEAAGDEKLRAEGEEGLRALLVLRR